MRQVSVFLTTYQHVIPILTGADLKEMGLKPGPQFKRILIDYWMPGSMGK